LTGRKLYSGLSDAVRFLRPMSMPLTTPPSALRLETLLADTHARMHAPVTAFAMSIELSLVTRLAKFTKSRAEMFAQPNARTRSHHIEAAVDLVTGLNCDAAVTLDMEPDPDAKFRVDGALLDKLNEFRDSHLAWLASPSDSEACRRRHRAVTSLALMFEVEVLVADRLPLESHPSPWDAARIRGTAFLEIEAMYLRFGCIDVVYP